MPAHRSSAQLPLPRERAGGGQRSVRADHARGRHRDRLRRARAADPRPARARGRPARRAAHPLQAAGGRRRAGRRGAGGRRGGRGCPGGRGRRGQRTRAGGHRAGGARRVCAHPRAGRHAVLRREDRNRASALLSRHGDPHARVAGQRAAGGGHPAAGGHPGLLRCGRGLLRHPGDPRDDGTAHGDRQRREGHGAAGEPARPGRGPERRRAGRHPHSHAGYARALSRGRAPLPRGDGRPAGTEAARVRCAAGPLAAVRAPYGRGRADRAHLCRDGLRRAGGRAPRRRGPAGQSVPARLPCPGVYAGAGRLAGRLPALRGAAARGRRLHERQRHRRK